MAVLAGSEHERTYRRGADNTLGAGTETRSGAEPVTTLIPPGDIHRVRNLDDGIAVSLHVYGADLGAAGSSVHRVYDVHDGNPRHRPDRCCPLTERPRWKERP